MCCDSVQVKKLKTQLEQKNGTENSPSPDGEIHENGTDQNIIELQSKNLHAWNTAEETSRDFIPQQLKDVC